MDCILSVNATGTAFAKAPNDRFLWVNSTTITTILEKTPLKDTIVTVNTSAFTTFLKNGGKNGMTLNTTELTSVVMKDRWKVVTTSLVHVESLVISLILIWACLLLLVIIFNSFRLRTRNSTVKALLRASDTLAYSLLTYIVGVLSTPINELTQLWVVLLPEIGANVDNLKIYRIGDGTEELLNKGLRDLIYSILVACMNGVQGTVHFGVPIWIIWSLSQIRTFSRLISFVRAAQSNKVGKNSKIIEEYMIKFENNLSSKDEVDPITMKGYKYLVMGEEKLKLEALTGNEAELITVEKVWQCKGKLLLSTHGDPDGQLKDVLLSYALFKLQRRRFDVLLPPDEAELSKSRDFVNRGLLPDHQRAFRVIEVELAFLGDYYSTRFPIIFANGLPILNILVFLAILGSCGLAGAILIEYRKRFRDMDVIITAVLLITLTIKEAWKLVTYIFSDWMKIELLCRYVANPYWQRSFVVEKMFGFLCRYRLLKPWWGKMNQYSLLHSFDYNPSNLMNKVTLGFRPKHTRGAKKGKPIKVPREVKQAVIEFLKSNDCQPTNGKTSLERNGVLESLSWAIEHDSYAQTILVWHVATELCEMGTLKMKDPPEDIRSNYLVATSLSKYCAYLLVFDQSLLPLPDCTAEHVFDQVVEEAQSFFMKCKSEDSRCQRMLSVTDEEKGTTIQKGALVGKFLLGEDESLRWKVLADFWVEMLLRVASYGKLDAHKQKLADGGEFITHIWALLSHAGISHESNKNIGSSGDV